MPPQIATGTILYNRDLAQGQFRMRVDCGTALREALPGQFVMLRVSDHTDPLLRRPFSLCRIEDRTAEILYRVVGRGTEIMAAWKEGQSIHFIGPLGRGFTVPETMTTAYLVAGGIGIAPLLCLAENLTHHNNKPSIRFFMGCKNAGDIALLDDCKPLRTDAFIATENGERGFHGLVTDLFKRHLENNNPHDKNHTLIFGCGPLPMAQVLSGIAAEYTLRCQLSLEAHMACGIGACLGCVIKTTAAMSTTESTGAGYQYQRVCVDGPVFDSTELMWNS